MYYWAIIRSSRRFVRVQVFGSVFLVIAGRDVHGWYRRHDKRFRLLPYGWTP